MSFTNKNDNRVHLTAVTDTYNYQNTVPKSCVHRAVVGEVFLTDVRKIHDDKFTTAGYLPKSHIYFNDLPYQKSEDRVYDAILLLEICRQTSIYVTHNFFSVPYSARFVFDDADFILLDKNIPYKPECSNVIVEVDIAERKFRKTELTGLIFRMNIYVDGTFCAQKTMNISWMDERKWQRLRNNRPLHSHSTIASFDTTAREVGRQLIQNVVIGNKEISDRGLTTTVIVDQDHPSIFDHPLDHVPGMLLIEAYRQSALLAINHRLNIPSTELVINRYKVSFKRFCEFHLPVYCHVWLDRIHFTGNKNNTVIPMTIFQNEEVVSTAELTIMSK
ncbi:hypothetical protein FCJ30_01675 [Salmonella enterica]|uniref:A-factor biosynthesis hotdog domain-containing protein n=1 Tax=Salmonella newport TaxID=108619 RepID=A0A3V2Y5P4_SALNE|nr:AfsA-related hotdog domain-containing protein [Salmonella enterica]ECS5597257.1 hypothetical protein [Salmonella enterica subsp. enterica]EAA7395818.1 hypothetical protein [Salmonella enterica subsp. enterica serovar Newport]EAM6499153.1 hypothetical protein [Salmonella enterica]EAO0497472.1 hypothetical protein [Salmonella enterica]EAO4475099.1 hypothetical protein [Salmonella enterica]